jgi:hypothetical protein
MSKPQRYLVGSYFLHEYSFEASALFNPSIVRHPDQSGAPAVAAIGNSSRNQARFRRRHQISATLAKRILVDLRLLAFFARSLLGR